MHINLATLMCNIQLVKIHEEWDIFLLFSSLAMSVGDVRE